MVWYLSPEVILAMALSAMALNGVALFFSCLKLYLDTLIRTFVLPNRGFYQAKPSDSESRMQHYAIDDSLYKAGVVGRSTELGLVISASRSLDGLTELKDDSKTWRHLLISVLYRPRSLQYWPSSASLRANVSITMRSLSSLFHLRSLKLLPLFGMTWPSFRARDTQL